MDSPIHLMDGAVKNKEKEKTLEQILFEIIRQAALCAA